jgi:hypothetical protein
VSRSVHPHNRRSSMLSLLLHGSFPARPMVSVASRMVAHDDEARGRANAIVEGAIRCERSAW